MTRSKAASEPKAQSEAEWVKRDTLTTWSANPRKHNDGPQKVARSIKRFGWGSPMLVRREDRKVVAGHGRWLGVDALTTMWAKASERARARRWHPDAVRVVMRGEVLVRFMDLSETMASQLAIVDNRIPEDSEWDKDLLGDLLRDMRDDALDLSALGFDGAELAKLLGDDAPPSTTVVEIVQSFAIVIECRDENHQAELLERFQEDGLECRALI